LSLLVLPNVLLTSLLDDVGALAFFVPVLPVARVDIGVGVGHHTFTVTLTIFPVAVVISDTNVFLLANAVLLVGVPLSTVSDSNLSVGGHFIGIGIDTLTLSHLV
jgi:hypothetical protein